MEVRGYINLEVVMTDRIMVVGGLRNDEFKTFKSA